MKVPSPAGKLNQPLHKFCLQRKAPSAVKCASRWLLNSTRWHGTQIITGCGNFTQDFKQCEFCASSLIDFPIKCKLYFQRTLDHWATGQFSFSSSQIRSFWLQDCSSSCTDSGLSPLFTKEWTETLNWFCWTILSRLQFSLCWCGIANQTFSFHSTSFKYSRIQHSVNNQSL